MTEQELLRAIQNADQSFYDKAEQRIHQKEVRSMKHIIMRKVMTGAAAVAVLAVTVTGGIHLMNQKQNGLTEPSASTPATAPVELQNSPIAANTAAQTSAAENAMGGHGKFQFSKNSEVFCDDDYWYHMDECAPKSDAKYLPTEQIVSRVKNPLTGRPGTYRCDKESPILYHIVDRDTAYGDYAEGVYTVSEDGTETKINFGDLAKCFEGQLSLQKPHAAFCSVTHLKDGKYYISGYFYEDADYGNATKYVHFWEIYDTDAQTGAGKIIDIVDDCDAEIFYDGDTGVYISLADGVEPVRYIVHCRADGSSDMILKGDFSEQSWFIEGGCVYYINSASDYCKYDMTTKETTVLHKGTNWYKKLVYANGKVYVISNVSQKEHKLLYGSPDMTDAKEFDLPMLEGTVLSESYCIFVEAVFDNTVLIMVQPADDIYNATNALLCHTDTGAVQYMYHPEAYHPSDAPVTNTTLSAKMNLFGGFGSLQFSRNSNLLCDDECLYMNTLDCAPKSDAKYLPLQRIPASSPVYSAKGMYLSDKQSDVLYRIVYHLQADASLKEGVYLVSDDGRETMLDFGDLTKCFAGKTDFKHPLAAPTEIMHLKDGKYYVTGYLYEESEPDNMEKFRYFWEICDTDTQTGAGQLVDDTSAPVFYDGDTGVYTAYDSYDNVRHFVHRIAYGSEINVFESESVRHIHNWFVDSNCIYYVDYASGDYCKYDMKAKRNTVLVKQSGWNDDSIFYADGTFYAISVTEQKLLYGSPDRNIVKEMNLQTLDSNPYYGDYYVEAVFGNTVVVKKQITDYDDITDMSQKTVDDYNYMMLYHTDTGAVQYLYDPMYFTPPEATAQTTAPAVTTTTAATTTTTTAATTTTTATTVNTNKTNQKNVLGGYGELLFSRNSGVLSDDKFWYEDIRYSAEKSDAKYMKRTFSEHGREFTYPNFMVLDSFDNQIYHYTASDSNTVKLFNPDGTETVMFTDLYTPFRKQGDDTYYMTSIEKIAHIPYGSMYYIEASALPGRDSDDTQGTDFWVIYDMENHTSHGQIEEKPADGFYNRGSRVYSDYLVGDAVYVGYTYCKEPVDIPYTKQIVRRTADGKQETVLNADIEKELWFEFAENIYYVARGSLDYCKYDIPTGKTTVILKNSGFTDLYFSDYAYAVKNGETLFYGEADDLHERYWNIEYPEGMEVYAKNCSILGVADGVVFLKNNDASYAENPTADLYSRHDYTILYHDDNGSENVQFTYDANFYTPPKQ